MGRIFDIQRFSTHDGPGIRTTVFLKGCPLRCFWCQNPEGLAPDTQLQFTENRCSRCGHCAAVCPVQAHRLRNGGHHIDYDRCTQCGACMEVCLAGAPALVGMNRNADEIAELVAQDRPYYRRSGGGVTLSGGDPMMQPAFTAEVLAACRERGIHTALDSSLCCPADSLAQVLPLVDLMLADIKHMDPTRHRAGTGQSNAQILANIATVAASGTPLIVRIPVVPTFNASVGVIREIAEFAATLASLAYVELLPFHRLGEAKYAALGMTQRTSHLAPLTRPEMAALTAGARQAGVTVKLRNSAGE